MGLLSAEVEIVAIWSFALVFYALGAIFHLLCQKYFCVYTAGHPLSGASHILEHQCCPVELYSMMEMFSVSAVQHVATRHAGLLST